MTKTRKEWNELYNKLESKYKPVPSTDVESRGF